VTTRKLTLSCNLLLTAKLEQEGETTEITIEDARHATIGYATGEAMSDEYRTGVGRKTIVLGLQALIDKLNAADNEQLAVPVLTQKGADA
jgi:hypothetical protein